MRWRTGSASGMATPVRFGTSDSALFWFFRPTNWEVIVKVLDGCAANGHVWVFIAAITNQEYTVEVSEETGAPINRRRTYTNPQGTRSPAFTDTQAFSCP